MNSFTKEELLMKEIFVEAITGVMCLLATLSLMGLMFVVSG